MKRLDELDLLTSYYKGQHDIANDFYIPCMNRSNNYDRAVGFFSSSIYMISWPCLKDFVLRGGKIRIICSPLLSKNDLLAIEEGYELRKLKNQKELIDDIDRTLKDPQLRKPAQILATLVSLGVVDFRIAFVKHMHPKHKRIFHDKVGIFKDCFGNMVAFTGSMNETWHGLSPDGNLESIDVNVTWYDEREKQRVLEKVQYFEALWDNQYPEAEVEEFPKIAKEKLHNAAKGQEWEQLLDEVISEMNSIVNLTAEPWVGGRIPRPHQSQALKSWLDQGRRGILEHATGSGKTFTALCAIRNSLERGEVPFILVPSDLLLKHWYKEITESYKDLDIRILLCGGGNSNWKKGLLRPWTKPSDRDKPKIVLATLKTAYSDEFLNNIYQGDHLFIVVDEVHRIGSAKYRKILSLNSGPRLGLSATPRRAGDPEGTKKIFDYFGDIIQPPFTLQDAIKAGALTPYIYNVHRIELTPLEQKQWDSITKSIKKLYAIYNNSEKKDLDIERRIKHLLIRRAKIVKGAKNKVEIAKKIIVENYYPEQRWIVYCDDIEQLRNVVNKLRENGIEALEYHHAMEGDKEQTLNYFEMNGGVIVSIKCLDEGVDIPTVSHALVLASSKNPREFIQRRGRVLRKAEGKSLAYIHDVIVTPNTIESDDTKDTSIIRGEIARAIEFGQGASNPSAIYELKRILVRLNIDYTKFIEEGYEDDDE